VVVIAEIFISKQEVAGDIIAPVMAIPTGGGVMRVSSAIKPGGCHYEGRIMNAYEIVHILVTQLEPKAPGDPEPPLASVWCNFIALFSPTFCRGSYSFSTSKAGQRRSPSIPSLSGIISH